MIQYKQAYQKYKQLIPLIILSCLTISTLLTSLGKTIEMNGVSYESDLTIKHYAAFLAIVLNWVSFISFRRIFKYVLSLTLLLGIINFINFTMLETTWRIGFDNLQIGFQPTSFWILVLTYIINFKRANSAAYDLFGPTTGQADQSAQRAQAAQIDKFKDRFSTYSDEQLNDILKENKLVPEALHAVRQVLTEREKV